MDDLKRWRRDLHQIPELGLEETQTTAYLKAELEKMGYQPQPLLETGLMSLLIMAMVNQWLLEQILMAYLSMKKQV